MGSTVNDLAAPHFAEGRRLEGLGDYDLAFEAFARGNAIKRAALAPNAADRFILGATELRRQITADFVRAHAGQGNPTRAPIFIVGMPRSGSTLIEQILASHRKVQGMGETPIMAALMAKAFPFDPMGGFAPGPAAEVYLSRIRDEGWNGVGRFTDKQLTNITAVAHIHLMFPNSVIIHAAREPADTCLSCFRTEFGAVAATRFAHDLGEIGRLYRAYREIMDHWTMVLMGRVVTIQHEALVGAPREGMERLLTACGLEWDDSALRFHENQRPVLTASAQQVRQPIFSTSIGRWRRYQRHLGPLFEALGPYAPKDG